MATALQLDRYADEVVARIAAENREAGLLYADFIRLTDEGHRIRMEAVLSGRGKGPVNFRSTIKRFVETNLPSFNLEETLGDLYRFQKPITEGFAICLVFEKIHHFGLGKAFTLQIGIAEREGEDRRLYSLFKFFDRETLEWTYGTADDLQSCLREAATLLSMGIPKFEEEWRRFIVDQGSRAAPSLPKFGELSFREACQIAQGSLSSTCAEFSYLSAAWLRPESLALGGRFPSPESSSVPTGRLSAGESWLVRFADTVANRTISVRVPHTGNLTYEKSNRFEVVEGTRHRLTRALPKSDEMFTLPPGVNVPAVQRSVSSFEEFVDSTEIARISEATGGVQFRQKNPNCRLVLQLNAPFTSSTPRTAVWSADYHVLTGASRDHLGLTISATTKQILSRSDMPNDG